MRTPRKYLIVLATLTAMGIFGMVPNAYADEFGKCNTVSGCKPDNYEHTYCYATALSGTYTAPIAAAMETLDSQSKYYDTFIATCTNITDVRFETSTSITARGDYTCLAKNWAGECERARIRLNPNQVKDAVNIRKTACHEIGHSCGLAHGGTTDCMLSGAVTVPTYTYDSHHVAHLNA